MTPPPLRGYDPPVSLVSILLLAVGLAMDATAVAAARGLAVREVRFADALRLALFFGAFQAAMPFLGWVAGARFGRALAAWDHWIAFALLGGIGAKMLWEAAHPDADDAPDDRAGFDTRTLLVLAVATSIDALAAGVTLPLLHAPMALTLSAIGLVTFALSLAGVYAGRRFGARLGPRLDALGGVVLIGIGARILALHLAGRA